jgi:O-acetyl-ADP-ribose deacetylase (regulator of RNase III)
MLYNEEDFQMIHDISGDLLQSNCTVIAHQCNCWGVMGSGIAKQIRDRYPKVHEADKKYPVPYGAERLGHFSYAWAEHLLICNLYGQNRYGRKGTYTNIHALRQSLEKMFDFIRNDLSIPAKIGLPYGIGSGLAGGDWKEIFQMLQEVSEHKEHDIFLYQLNS